MGARCWHYFSQVGISMTSAVCFANRGSRRIAMEERLKANNAKSSRESPLPTQGKLSEVLRP